MSHIGQVIADTCAVAEWFIQTIASQIDNREIATMIVIIMLLVLVIANGSGKLSLRVLSRSFHAP